MTTYAFDVSVVVSPHLTAKESTIWPAINTLDDKIDELIDAEDALIARLKQRESP